LERPAMTEGKSIPWQRRKSTGSALAAMHELTSGRAMFSPCANSCNIPSKGRQSPTGYSGDRARSSSAMGMTRPRRNSISHVDGGDLLKPIPGTLPSLENRPHSRTARLNATKSGMPSSRLGLSQASGAWLADKDLHTAPSASSCTPTGSPSPKRATPNRIAAQPPPSSGDASF